MYQFLSLFNRQLFKNTFFYFFCSLRLVIVVVVVEVEELFVYKFIDIFLLYFIILSSYSFQLFFYILFSILFDYQIIFFVIKNILNDI